jgi:hypothetical protein
MRSATLYFRAINNAKEFCIADEHNAIAELQMEFCNLIV